MREIKFRGKDILNKNWYYGSLAKDNSQKAYYIIDNEEGIGRDVVEDSIGQYTGLKDKNGFEIYEGDIVKVHYIGGDGTENNKVIFYRGTFCLDYSKDYKPLLNELNHCCEIIGNIYENENLLDKAGD